MGVIAATTALTVAPLLAAPPATALPSVAADPAPAALPTDGSVPPPGANDWNCTPTADHPRAVVLVHGTYSNQDAWNAMSPALKAEGFCVFTLNYGKDLSSVAGRIPGYFATADIAESAGQLAVFVDRVLAATGTGKVDIVAHSQGGPMSRQYLRFNGGTNPDDPGLNKVLHLITISGTNHGTTVSGLAALIAGDQSADDLVEPVVGQAAMQQLAGSRFITHLNAGGDTRPGVHYTAIGDKADLVSTPPAATFLTAGPGATVRNVWVQSLCPGDTTRHGRMPFDPAAIFIVLATLSPGYAETHHVTCPAPGASSLPMPALLPMAPHVPGR
ncbi:esterase/lipase family protein [Tomitella gaofuii]|uniref:esterase/lipase family protein n=1 Tax=Tomitella gaofuii TaxID=2760083 RepID=UPI0015FB8C81|nr:alpha/beta fold hydrolase [Tomitella gaofuii]